MSDSPLDLFCFAPGDPDRWLDLVQAGYGWWMAPGLQLCFMRPLSGALIAVDEALLGDWPLLMHAHSLLWAAATAALVHLVLRRLLPARVAAFGALLWVLDDARWMSSGWLANRNALVTAAPILAGLWAHLRWRQEGWAPGRWLGPLAFAVALAGGEPAVAGFALLGALVLGGLDGPQEAAPDPVGQRLLRLLPYAAVGLVWAGFWVAGGYGARQSGAYLDPLAEPAGFAVAVLTRLPVLVGGVLLNLPPDAWVTTPAARVPLVVAGLLAALGLAALLARRLPSGQRPRALWLGAAVLLTLAPSCATPPTSRVMTLAAVPAMALLGWLVVGLEGEVGRAGRWLRGGVLVWHGPLAALSAVAMLSLVAGLNHVAQGYDESPALAGIADKIVVIPSAPDVAVGLYPPFARRSKGLPTPRAWHTLALQRPGLTVRRTAVDTLEIASPEVPLFGNMVEGLLAAPAVLPRAGEVRQLGALRVEVLSATEAGVTHARFVFVAPLDDPRFVWLAPIEGGWEPWTPPPVGGVYKPPLLPTIFGVGGSGDGRTAAPARTPADTPAQ